MPEKVVRLNAFRPRCDMSGNLMIYARSEVHSSLVLKGAILQATLLEQSCPTHSAVLIQLPVTNARNEATALSRSAWWPGMPAASLFRSQSS